jgi:putative ABC transport system substrate-binding protein
MVATSISPNSGYGARMRLRLFAVLGIVLLLAPAAGPRADGRANILFVTSHTSSHYLDFVDEATRALRAGESVTYSTSSVSASEVGTRYRNGADAPFDMVVALGTIAAQAVQRWQPGVPVLYALIPKASYDALKQSGHLACPAGQCSAVFIDQPLTRMFDVLQAAFPRRQRQLGVVLGPTSARQRAMISTLARQRGLTLQTAVIGASDELLPALDSVLKRSGVLLSLADPVVYNSHTAKSVLLTTYRYRVPVLAYSRAYAEAGATLSVYSTPRQISRQATAIIESFFRGERRTLPEAQYPQYYSIRINGHVADSLGLDLKHNLKLQSIAKDANDEKAQYPE